MKQGEGADKREGLRGEGFESEVKQWIKQGKLGKRVLKQGKAGGRGEESTIRSREAR